MMASSAGDRCECNEAAGNSRCQKLTLPTCFIADLPLQDALAHGADDFMREVQYLR
jgi:hypothetical protein